MLPNKGAGPIADHTQSWGLMAPSAVVERSGRSGVAWESRGCGLGVEGRRSGLLGRYPIDVGPSSWGGRCFVPGDCAPNRWDCSVRTQYRRRGYPGPVVLRRSTCG